MEPKIFAKYLLKLFGSIEKGKNFPYWSEEIGSDLPGFLTPLWRSLRAGPPQAGNGGALVKKNFPHPLKCLQNGLVFAGPGKKIDSLSGRFFWFPLMNETVWHD
ncbi:MAG: hypothetical protein V3U48_03760 [Rhodospirillales bacterium]